MGNLSIRELAFLAALNDSHALKRQGYAGYFRDPVFLHNLYIDIFESGADTRGVYPDHIRPLIARAEDIRKSDHLLFYIDTIRGYQQNGVRVLPVFDAGYPKKLAEILDPPFVLYQVGREESLGKPAVAVVGTRMISAEGVETVRETVEILVRLGYVVVSGLARGTDACAHTAAMDYGGETIAVLPGDVRAVVPRENRDLAGRVTSSGSLLGEITHLVRMHKGRFLERNRITSALSDGVVVIETGESGGSIQQAETAFRQGRPVYVMRPRDLSTKTVAGYRRLVSGGATPVESPEDLPQYLERGQHQVSGVTTLADFW